MYIQFYKNLYSGYNNCEVKGWDFVINAIKDPQTKYITRDDIPLWSFYVPIESPTLDDNLLPRGCADNMRQFTALQIDFDDNVVRIEDFCEKYKYYTFYLYTSYRHSDEHHKYRVIIPLDSSYGNGLLKCPENKELLLSMFVGCDKSTINSFRKQRIPALDPNRSNAAYRYVINEGKLYELPWNTMVRNYKLYEEKLNDHEIIEDNNEMLPDWYYEIKGLYVPRPNNIKDNVRISVIRDMNNLPWHNRGTGVVHYTLCKLYGKLRTAGFSSHESEIIMINQAPYDAHKEIRGIAKLN